MKAHASCQTIITRQRANLLQKLKNI